MIKVSNLSKSYGSFTAVDSISFSIPEGKICGFLGMNGAGKTTTIRMLTGIIEPSSGDVEISGYDIKQFPDEVKKITGYIPDRPYLYPSMTPLEFLELIGDLYLVPISSVHENSSLLLRKYGLWEKRFDLIQGFSHGMKQRLATCAALLHDPKILIIDEPMVGLDPLGAQNLKSSLREYAEKGVTIFLSTHSLHIAEELCDNIIIINEGKIISKGTVPEIKALVTDNPSNTLEGVFIELTSRHI